MVKSREQIIRKIEAQIAVADEIGSDFISLIKGEGKAINRLLEEDEERIAIMAEGNVNNKDTLNEARTNDFNNVVDWLNNIISDPEGYKDWYSDSEQAWLAEKALEIIGWRTK